MWPTGSEGNKIVIPPNCSPEHTLFQTLCSHTPGADVSEYSLVGLENDYGEYFPRIYRPSIAGRRPHTELDRSQIFVKNQYKDPSNLHYQAYPIDDSTYSKSLNQIIGLRNLLVDLLRVVDADPRNFFAFGHAIRDLMMLACTEVESQWKGVLRENGYSVDARLNTGDYVKLLKPMRLGEYEVSLPLYPECPAISPFKHWSASNPTDSLSWYNSYNAVKHDREECLDRARLIHAIEAVIAVAVMNIAQFGMRETWLEILGSFFQFEDVPTWEFQEMYNFGPKTPLNRRQFPF